ncbi:MAG: hypothetical protein H6659_12695 [Ardenticatenaceae bacterium]|nr:hypothetical protein [Ardenticatenaceae bacterium]
MDRLEAEFGPGWSIYRLNASEPDVLTLQESYGQRGHPTFVVLDETGAVTAQFIGQQPIEVLRAALAAQ